MGFLEERDFTNIPTIPEFYKGKSIFITGGSGFMGKVLIEKLLYSCSDLDRIYLLMRSKRGVDCEDRLTKIYSTACFDRLRNEKPAIFKNKVVVISGDVTNDGLGITEEDRIILTDRVNIIFHVAASVRFDDTLQYAVRMNLNGTKQVLDLAKDMKNLCAFVHVSTAYSNTNRNPIEEIMYPPLANVEDTLAICENLDDHILKVLTPKYIGEMPNTYVFSKQLADHLVYETKGQLPAVIVRPSIVLPSYVEPIPGWIENFNGPIGLQYAAAMGVMRTFYADPDINSDYIPVDFSIRSLIVAAWLRGTKGIEIIDDIPIYNCASGKTFCSTLQDVVNIGLEKLPEIPLGPSLWHPNTRVSSSKTMNLILVIFLQLLPAILIDTLLKAFGRKPMLLKIQRRLYGVNMTLEYYTTLQWFFDNKNFLLLRSCIKNEDLKSFYYEMEKIDIYKFFYNGMIGVRRYMLKNKDEDLPKHRALYWRMYYLHIAVLCVFWSYMLWLILNSNYFQNILAQDIDINFN